MDELKYLEEKEDDIIKDYYLGKIPASEYYPARWVIRRNIAKLKRKHNNFY